MSRRTGSNHELVVNGLHFWPHRYQLPICVLPKFRHSERLGFYSERHCLHGKHVMLEQRRQCKRQRYSQLRPEPHMERLFLRKRSAAAHAERQHRLEPWLRL